MFENLSTRISNSLHNIGNSGRLTEDNIKNTLREVRTALLEADVALPMIKEFISDIQVQVIGQEINKSLTPGQEFIKIVYTKLIKIIGDENNTFNLATQPPATIMLIGPLGSGKTTTVAKLGKYLQERYNKKILIVSVDIYRPAAIKQLELLSKKININFFMSDIDQKPTDIVKLALQEAKNKFYDILLVDTAGCLHIDKKIMSEIKFVYNIIKPIENLFIMDAMSGQDAMNVVQVFNQSIPITGIILTKVDSDARGGAALSAKYITGKPIKFICMGETIDALEPFHPKRLVKRILGMNDMLSFIEEIENKVDYKQTKKLALKVKQGDVFNLNDFLNQLKQIHNMSNISNLINKLPGISNKLLNGINSQMDPKILIRTEAIINSMTITERCNPNIIKGSRKRRIALGSGTEIQDINKLLSQFNYMQRMMKKIKHNGINKIIHDIKNIKSSFFYKN